MAKKSRLLNNRTLLVGALAVFVCTGVLMYVRQTPYTNYDLIIRNGEVLDGTGRRALKTDIFVNDGKIVSIGWKWRTRGSTEIDATGLIVTPGFIDSHTHVERNLPNGRTPFSAASFAQQG